MYEGDIYYNSGKLPPLSLRFPFLGQCQQKYIALLNSFADIPDIETEVL